MNLYISSIPFLSSWVLAQQIKKIGMKIRKINFAMPFHCAQKFWSKNNNVVRFVRVKSRHDGLSVLLKHVGSFMTLCRWFFPLKSFIADSVISELESRTVRKLLYVFIWVFLIFIQEYSDDLRKYFYEGYRNTLIELSTYGNLIPQKSLQNLLKVLYWLCFQ